MTPVLSGVATATGAGAFWLVTRRAARARNVDAGTFPFRAVATGAIVAMVAASAGTFAPSRALALAACTAAAAGDRRTGLVVDPLTAAFAGAAFAIAVATGGVAAAALGASVAGGSLLVLYLVTARRGIGLGDVKLAAGIGAALGPADALTALGAAFVLGGSYAATLLLTRRAALGQTVRFAPFLAAGVGVAVLRGSSR